MPRPPVKKTRVLAEAEALGKAIGEMKAHKRKPLEESLREHIGKMIDRVDPLELIAVVAGTFIVHETISSIESTVSKIATLAQQGSKKGEVGSADLFNYLGIMFGQVNIFNLKVGEVAWGNPEKEGIPNSDKNGSSMTNDLMTWGVSFLISYLLIQKAKTANLSTITDLLVGIGLG